MRAPPPAAPVRPPSRRLVRAIRFLRDKVFARLPWDPVLHVTVTVLSGPGVVRLCEKPLLALEAKRYVLNLTPRRWTAGVGARIRTDPLGMSPSTACVTSVSNVGSTSAFVLTATIDNGGGEGLELHGSEEPTDGISVYATPIDAALSIFRYGFRQVGAF